ncbi:MAG: hypothetical protein Q8S05_02625, partial [Sulfuricella sp.]|nr:hypothetical protein [Sulfuricella sp.]
DRGERHRQLDRHAQQVLPLKSAHQRNYTMIFRLFVFVLFVLTLGGCAEPPYTNVDNPSGERVFYVKHLNSSASFASSAVNRRF